MSEEETLSLVVKREEDTSAASPVTSHRSTSSGSTDYETILDTRVVVDTERQLPKRSTVDEMPHGHYEVRKGGMMISHLCVFRVPIFVAIQAAILLGIIAVSSVMVYDYRHSSSKTSIDVGECVTDQADPPQTLNLPTNSTYRHRKVDSATYSVMKYTFANDHPHVSVDFILRPNVNPITEFQTYIETGKRCDLPPKADSSDCSIMRYWPTHLTQTGYVSCAFEEPEKSGYIMWKWVPLNASSFNIDCLEISRADSNPKKRWQWCGHNDEPKELNIKKVLDDEERSSVVETVVFKFCLKNQDDQGVVKYHVNFTEEWEVDTEPYNLYTMDSNGGGIDSDSSTSTYVPLIHHEDTHVDIVVKGGDRVVTIEQTGIKRAASFRGKHLHIPVLSGASAILVGAAVLLVISIWLACELYCAKRKKA